MWQLFVHSSNASTDRLSQTELTCTDGDRLHKLFPPGVCADNQRQVGLLNELVNSALPITSTTHFISKQLNPRIGDKSHSGEIELVSHALCSWREEEKSLKNELIRGPSKILVYLSGGRFWLKSAAGRWDGSKKMLLRCLIGSVRRKTISGHLIQFWQLQCLKKGFARSFVFQIIKHNVT